MLCKRESIPFFGPGVNPLNMEQHDFLRGFYKPIILEGRERYYVASIDNRASTLDRLNANLFCLASPNDA